MKHKIKVTVSPGGNKVSISRYKTTADRPKLAMLVTNTYEPTMSSLSRVMTIIRGLDKPLEMTVYL